MFRKDIIIHYVQEFVIKHKNMYKNRILDRNMSTHMHNIYRDT